MSTSDNEENLMDDNFVEAAGVEGGGELRIDNGSSTPDSVFDGKTAESGDKASLNGSVDGATTTTSSQRTSSLPSLSGILSSFSARGRGIAVFTFLFS